MLQQFAALNASGNILKHFYCETQEQASNKCKFTWPQDYFFVKIESTGRRFANLDEFINFMEAQKNRIILS